MLVAALGLSHNAASALGQARSNPDQRESPEVVRLNLNGVKSVDRTDLQRSLSTDVSSCKSVLVYPFCKASHSKVWWKLAYFDDIEFRRDVLRIKVYYYKRGFRETEVDTLTRREGRGLSVTFRITEGAPTLVRVVRVNGAEPPLVASTITADMQIRTAKPLDLLLVDSSALLLRNSLWNVGHADAVITPAITVDDTNRAANVRFDVDPKWRARVASIVITGNDKIHERTIRRSLTFKEGDAYRLFELNRSLRNLYESNLFRRASIQTVTGDSAKQVTVQVQEAPLRSVRSSFGFNTIDFFQAEERFTQFNFFGGARRLELRGVVGNLGARQLQDSRLFRRPNTRGESTYLQPTFELSADVTQPWFAGSNTSLGLSAFAHRRSAAGIFVDNGFGTSATATRQISDRVPLVLNYRFEISKVSAGDVYFCQFFGVCEVGVIGALREAHRLSPISLSFYADRSDDVFRPRSGFVTRAEFEHANSYTLSDYHYVRGSGAFTKFWAIGRTWSLATRAGAGYVRSLASTGSAVGGDAATGREIIHPRKRFYAGGSQSVRGYAENQLGPRILTIDPALLFKVDTTLSMAAICERTADGGVACPQRRIDDIKATFFQPRPLGGSSLVEGNIELRLPLDNLFKDLGAAIFVDGAFVGEGALSGIAKGKGAITPGVGFRYYTSAGAIRIDLGVRPTLRENLSVVTEVTDGVEKRSQIVTVKTLETGRDVTKSYSPISGNGFLTQIFNRLQLHLSIGQAF